MLGPSDEHRGGVPFEQLHDRFEAYVSALDRTLPGVLTGLYVVGSLALGDYSTKFSDIDIVAVSASEWTPSQLRVACQAHHHLYRRKHPVRVAYVSTAQIGADPAGVDVACFEDTTRLSADAMANPLTWRILGTTAIALRGPDHPEVWVSDEALEAWANRELQEHWREWLASVRHRPGSLLFKRSVAGKVLEVSRLYEVAVTGQVLSKLEACEAVIPQLAQRYARIIRDCTGYREGYHTSMYWAPFERKHDALDLIAELTGGVAAPA
jgi:aminoglycoside adenylyltransferase-like protein